MATPIPTHSTLRPDSVPSISCISSQTLRQSRRQYDHLSASFRLPSSATPLKISCQRISSVSPAPSVTDNDFRACCQGQGLNKIRRQDIPFIQRKGNGDDICKTIYEDSSFI